MIKNVLKDEKIDAKRYKIIDVPDIPTNSQWAKSVAKKTGKFDFVATASPFTKLLFEDSDYKVVDHSLIKRRFLSGTEIRRRILKNKNWERLVPRSVFIDLKKMGITDRLKSIVKTDNPYL